MSSSNRNATPESLPANTPAFEPHEITLAEHWLDYQLAVRGEMDTHSVVDLGQKNGLTANVIRCTLFRMLTAWCNAEKDPLMTHTQLRGRVSNDFCTGDNLVLSRKMRRPALRNTTQILVDRLGAAE